QRLHSYKEDLGLRIKIKELYPVRINIWATGAQTSYVLGFIDLKQSFPSLSIIDQPYHQPLR
ncbi:MAG: hypothetical protein RQ885_15775, partial [Desulfurococcales archaeon]|nr:hypothetical protein [Desulfurococcales archaeon]